MKPVEKYILEPGVFERQYFLHTSAEHAARVQGLDGINQFVNYSGDLYSLWFSPRYSPQEIIDAIDDCA